MDDNVTLKLAVRTLSPAGASSCQARVLERLTELERRGIVDDVEVTVWGKRVGLTTPDVDTDAGERIVETVDSFREWADGHGVSVDRFFERREVRSEFTGEEYAVLELPSMALAEYRDGELHWVSPCADGDTVYAVDDRLEMLETTALDRARERAERTPRPVAEE